MTLGPFRKRGILELYHEILRLYSAKVLIAPLGRQSVKLQFYQRHLDSDYIIINRA